MPDVYVHGRLDVDELDAAFARAFEVPRPAMFDGDDRSASYDHLFGQQHFAILNRLERRDFSMKLTIYTKGELDLSQPLSVLAHDLAQPVVVDIGQDITDDSAVLFTPTGEVLTGKLVSFGDYYPDESRDVAFIDDTADRYVLA